MKIAVVCSNGKAGLHIVQEAVNRGLDTTAIARMENKSVATTFIKKDLFELTKKDVELYDVIVTAFGVWEEKELSLHTTALMKLCDLLSGKQSRLLVVGGAGSLYMDTQHTLQVKDDEQFPEAFKPLAEAQSKALDALRTRSDVRWTFLSPASDFQANGERTGKYLLAGEEAIVNENGESTISYADYAVAMLDEILDGNHIQKRISVVAK